MRDEVVAQYTAVMNVWPAFCLKARTKLRTHQPGMSITHYYLGLVPPFGRSSPEDVLCKCNQVRIDSWDTQNNKACNLSNTTNLFAISTRLKLLWRRSATWRPLLLTECKDTTLWGMS